MGPDHPCGRVEEDEVELGEHLVRAEPGIPVSPLIDVGPELGEELPSDRRIGAVRPNDQVGIAE